VQRESIPSHDSRNGRYFDAAATRQRGHFGEQISRMTAEVMNVACALSPTNRSRGRRSEDVGLTVELET
jgi:hypothetical protein